MKEAESVPYASLPGEDDYDSSTSADIDALLRTVDERLSSTSTVGSLPSFLPPRARLWGASVVAAPRARSLSLEVAECSVMSTPAPEERAMTLWVFLALMSFGLANKILAKLATVPMRNYASTLTLVTTACYVPLSYAYIVTVASSAPNVISKRHRALPWRPFAVMGLLDAVAGLAQVFATTSLPGGLVVLLSQARIPVSMALSRRMLEDVAFSKAQLCGALCASAGVVVAVLPVVLASTSGSGGASRRACWSVVLAASTVPTCASSILKEKALVRDDLDAVFLNGRVAVFQLVLSLPLALAASAAAGIKATETPRNVYDGFRCLTGSDTLSCEDAHDDDECHADDCAPRAPFFVSAYCAANVAYNVLIIVVLKQGGATTLWVATTLLVPLAALAWALPFMGSQQQKVHATDAAALLLILAGIALYRFGADNTLRDLKACWRRRTASGRRGLLQQQVTAQSDAADFF